MPFSSTWMDLEIIILSEVSQKEKGKYHVSLICGVYNMTQINVSIIIYKKIDSHREQPCDCQGKEGIRNGWN